MLINWRAKYLFVHIPKTGGTSITQLLKKDCNRAILPLRALGYLFDNAGHRLPAALFPMIGYPYHITAEELRRQYGPDKYEALFSFAFVRNPWDLVVSEYFYIRQKKSHKKHRNIKNISAFPDFVQWKVDTGFYRPQYDWIYSQDGLRLVEFIGRFENYEADANEILAKLGIDSTVGKFNETKRNDFRSYYNDHSIELVSDMYEKDLNEFNYSW